MPDDPVTSLITIILIVLVDETKKSPLVVNQYNECDLAGIVTALFGVVWRLFAED